MKKLMVLVLFFLHSEAGRAGIPINVQGVKDSVVFIYAADHSGQVNPSKALGTGFLVGIPLKSDSRRGYFVLVTARHVLEPQWASCPSPNPHVVYLRLNKRSSTKAGGSEGVDFLPLQLTKNSKWSWVAHRNDDVDVAVLPIEAKRLDPYVYSLVPIAAFATPEEEQRLESG